MKVKIMDDFAHEYEDVTQGKVYEVVEECLMDYVIIDDQFDRNAILKEHCEIVTEEVMFQEGDRVKIFIRTLGADDLIEDWSLQGHENRCGRVISVYEDSEPSCLVQMEEGDTWYVPFELLLKLDSPNENETN